MKKMLWVLLVLFSTNLFAESSPNDWQIYIINDNKTARLSNRYTDKIYDKWTEKESIKIYD